MKNENGRKLQHGLWPSEGHNWTWAVAGILLTAATVLIGVIMSPGLGLPIFAASTAGLLALLIAVLKPKLLVCVSILGITFSHTIERVSGVDILGYLDETLVLSCFFILTSRRIAEHKHIRGIPGGFWFALFIVIGFFSSFANNVDPLLSAQSCFLSTKALLLALSVAQVDWTEKDLQRASKIFGWVVALLVLSGIANLLAPQPWANVFQTLGYVQYRVGGLPSLIGFTAHPLEFGGLMAFAALAVAAYRNHVQKGVISLMLLAGSIVSSVLSFRRTAITGMLAALFIERFRRFRTNTTIAAIIGIPIILYFGWDALSNVVGATYTDYFENADASARTVLTRDSFLVAMAHFPFGAGFGRFGSYLAGVHYSPEYVERGYQHIYGMGPGPNGRFLTDTQWPALLGEAGILGAAFFIIGLFLVFRRFWQLRSSNMSYTRWVAVTGMSWLVAIIVMSPGIPVFTAGTYFGPVFALIGISASLRLPDQLPSINAKEANYMHRNFWKLSGGSRTGKFS